MPSVTRSAAQKAKDVVENSKLSINNSGGISKTWVDSKWSSLKKHDSFSSSPSLKKSDRLVNRILKNPDLKKTASEKKRSTPSPPTKLEKHDKQHWIAINAPSNNNVILPSISTPRVTLSAAQKAKDDEKSQLSAKDSGGKTSADSSSTLTNSNLRRSSRGSSMKKHDPLSPSPSIRKSKQLVNRNLKDNKQHSSNSACAKRSEKGSCSAGSKESGKITPSLKSNNLSGNEQIRLGETARSTRENGKKEKEMGSADSVEPAPKKRLDSRTYRKYLVAQVLMLRSPGNETSNLEVCKDTTDDSNIRKEKDLNERDPGRGDEDIKFSSCLDIELTNFIKEPRNCSENVDESEKELCPPCKIPLPCSSNGLELEDEEGVEPTEMTKVVDMATAALPIAGSISNTSSEMIAECSISETRDACPVCDKPKSTKNSTLVLQRPISYCRGECDPATLSPCQNNPLLEATFPRGNDLSESLQVTRKRAWHYEEINEQEVGKDKLTKCQKLPNITVESVGSREVPLAGDKECPEDPELKSAIPSNIEPSESSNSGPARTNDGYILQTNRPSCSQQEDTPVLHNGWPHASRVALHAYKNCGEK